MMKVLDLYCGAGGCSMGYHQSGFQLIGVDNKPQPNYPFEFIQANALDFEIPDDIDLIHASPPCQKYSWSAKRWKKDWPDLIAPTREKLIESGKPFIMENVTGAPLLWPVRLCGTMFNLKVIRHRLFEIGNIDAWIYPPCQCRHKGTVSAGDYCTVAGHGGDGSGKFKDWQEAMGISWMTKEEMAQAIPPAYTRYLGKMVASEIS